MHGADHATWQPQAGIRQAMVGMRAGTAKGYIIIAGRSLRKVEERIATLGQQIALAWALSMISILMVVILQQVMTKKWSLEQPTS